MTGNSCAGLLQPVPDGLGCKDLMQYATLQWPVVQERIAKSRKFSQEPIKVGGKCKASGSAGAKGLGRSSKPKLGASGKMFDEQY
jgi:hypothetical protein